MSGHVDEDRLPVLVGVGQVLQRVDDPRDGVEPLELMAQAVECALEDAGAPELVKRADTFRVIRGAWRYEDPARVLAERFGASRAKTMRTPFGGNYVQVCVNHAARAIAEGREQVVVIAGAENGRSNAAAKRAGIKLPVTDAPGEPDLELAPESEMWHPVEQAIGLLRPADHYALYESAIRAARGESVSAHRTRISELWAGFSRVAQKNPYAWIREPVSAEQIAEPADDNPMITTPYPRRMNANSRVDMGAALLLCSRAVARELGIAEEKFVYLHSGTEANDVATTSERWEMHRSPGMRIAGSRALELAHLAPEDVDHCDVYSCFPSAVQVCANEIGLSQDRPLTVTGGLTFGGGPLNDYVLHSIASMALVLRADPGSHGLVTANGGYLAKHAFGVYSTDAPRDGFRYENLQAQVDALPRREVVDAHEGPVTIEAHTVTFVDDQPHHAFVSALDDEGRRAWSRVEDATLLRALADEAFTGRRARMDGQGGLSFD